MRPLGLHWISRVDPPDAFPPIENALVEPDGLLAAGGDLSEERLLFAYRHGIFPWFDEGQPILWWSPHPRCVIEPQDFHASRRLRRALNRSGFEISFNRAFDAVIAGCSAPRPGQNDTWITADMAASYQSLHRRGWAHSVEVWRDDELAGGLYGLAVGRVFFGESMFSAVTDGSKAALLALCRLLNEQEFALLDCQIVSPHLLTLGASLMSRSEFRTVLDTACSTVEPFDDWPPGRQSIRHYL